MKAISLWQPWASLIACGAKPYETRSWAPPRELIGQTIAVHAAKKIDKGAAQFATDLMYGQHGPDGFRLAEELAATMKKCPDDLMGKFGMATMPIGCVVCIARLDAAFLLGECVLDDPPTAKIVRAMSSRTVSKSQVVFHDEFGDYTAGRWAWLLKDVQVLDPPPPAVGRQGFFDLPQGWMTEAA